LYLLRLSLPSGISRSAYRLSSPNAINRILPFFVITIASNYAFLLEFSLPNENSYIHGFLHYRIRAEAAPSNSGY
jgi:hypothetical protein